MNGGLWITVYGHIGDGEAKPESVKHNVCLYEGLSDKKIRQKKQNKCRVLCKRVTLTEALSCLLGWNTVVWADPAVTLATVQGSLV